MNSAAQELITILRAAVLGDALPEGFAVRDAEALFRLAKMQDLGHLLLLPEGAEALFEGDLLAALEKERLRAVWRFGMLFHEEERIEALLAREGIPFLPLKGAYVRTLWPEPWMRTSCDIDLLVARESIPRAAELLAREAGFTLCGESPCNLSFASEGDTVHLELHFALCGVASSEAVLARAWDYTREENGRPVLNVPFLLLHLLSHLAMHLLAGGGGIRAVLDILLVRRCLPYDREELAALLCEASLTDFAAAVFRLADLIAGEGEEDALSTRLGNWLIGGQTYADLDRRTLLMAAEGKGAASTAGRFLRRLLLPYRDLMLSYPALRGRPYLYPYFSLVRLLGYLLRGRLGLALRNTRRRRATLERMTEEEKRDAESLLVDLGLKGKSLP